MLTSATIDGEDAAIDGWTILGTSSDSSGLYISIIDQTDGTYSGTARVKQGKIGEMSDALDNVSDEEIGSLTLLIENYEQSITSLDNQIYNEEKRLETLEASLTRKYAALDATLSYYENQSSLLSSQLAQLTSANLLTLRIIFCVVPFLHFSNGMRHIFLTSESYITPS